MNTQTSTPAWTVQTATHALAEPGGPLIDVLRPDGTTYYTRETLEQVRASRYPQAEVVIIDEWIAERAEVQHRPIEWREVPAHEAERMRGEVFPAAFGPRGAFLMGEPANHSYRNGAPMFDAFRATSWNEYGDPLTWEGSNRAITKAEFIAEMEYARMTQTAPHRA